MNCLGCGDFIKDAIGDGHGIGTCSSYEAGIKRGANSAQIKAARIARGNRADDGLFWGGGERKCRVFKVKQ